MRRVESKNWTAVEHELRRVNFAAPGYGLPRKASLFGVKIMADPFMLRVEHGMRSIGSSTYNR
jgi:hypothetical protein